jgi:hypothetical protein
MTINRLHGHEPHKYGSRACHPEAALPVPRGRAVENWSPLFFGGPASRRCNPWVGATVLSADRHLAGRIFWEPPTPVSGSSRAAGTRGKYRRSPAHGRLSHGWSPPGSDLAVTSSVVAPCPGVRPAERRYWRRATTQMARPGRRVSPRCRTHGSTLASGCGPPQEGNRPRPGGMRTDCPRSPHLPPAIGDGTGHPAGSCTWLARR